MLPWADASWLHSLRNVKAPGPQLPDHPRSPRECAPYLDLRLVNCRGCFGFRRPLALATPLACCFKVTSSSQSRPAGGPGPTSTLRRCALSGNFNFDFEVQVEKARARATVRVTVTPAGTVTPGQKLGASGPQHLEPEAAPAPHVQRGRAVPRAGSRSRYPLSADSRSLRQPASKGHWPL